MTVEPNEAAIVRSVLYASLFDYPLTLAQLRQTLVGSSQTPTEIRSVYGRSQVLQAVVEYRDGFFFPRGQQHLVRERQRREERSRVFLAHHRAFIRLACAMPYVKMVALSGSIAHLNLERDGDLDLCIVTSRHRVWSVAVAVVLLAKLLGRRQSVCANFVIAHSALAVEQRDLFAASQIVHLKPLLGADVYRQFLGANPFVSRFYPNFHPADGGSRLERQHLLVAWAKRGIEWAFTGPSAAVEQLCRLAYGAYLRRQAATWTSPEQVRLEPDCLKLHTHSHRDSVSARFDRLVAGAIGDGGSDWSVPISPSREQPAEALPFPRERSVSSRRWPRSIPHRFSPERRG